MKSITLPTAVLRVIETNRNLGVNFSAYDVTKELRSQVNTGVLELSDVQKDVINGSLTFPIDHNRVREIITELAENSLLPNFKKGYGNVNGNRFVMFEYQPILGGSTVSSVAGTGTSAQPVSTSPVTVTNATLTPSTNAQIVLSYLKNKLAKGETPTLKAVQSRMKGIAITVTEIAAIAKDAGYKLNANPAFSRSTVSK